jgi:hypothetical protein
MTYAKRYNLGQLLNIATDDDDDGNAANTKQWFSQSDYDLVEKNKSSYKTASELIQKIKNTKNISKEFENKIQELYKSSQ